MNELALDVKELARLINWDIIYPKYYNWRGRFTYDSIKEIDGGTADFSNLDDWSYDKVAEILRYIKDEKRQSVIDAIKNDFRWWVEEYVSRRHWEDCILPMTTLPIPDDEDRSEWIEVTIKSLAEKYYTGWCQNLQDYLNEHLNEHLNGNDLPPLNTPNAVILPSELGTERVRKYFARAIELGYMERTDTGYKWNKQQIRLGYFCLKVFDPPRPIKLLETLFGVTKLDASITQASYEPKRADVKKWRAEMDNDIFL